MEELINLVTQKTGIPEATAKEAVETVIGFLKDRLPDPIAGQVETILGGGDIGDLMGCLDRRLEHFTFGCTGGRSSR